MKEVCELKPSIDVYQNNYKWPWYNRVAVELLESWKTVERKFLSARTVRGTNLSFIDTKKALLEKVVKKGLVSWNHTSSHTYYFYSIHFSIKVSVIKSAKAFRRVQEQLMCGMTRLFLIVCSTYMQHKLSTENSPLFHTKCDRISLISVSMFSNYAI